MKIVHTEENDVTVLAIDGNVLQEEVTIFRNRIEDLLTQNKIKIVLDLDKTVYMSSMCLAVLIDVKKRLGVSHGDLKIARVKRVIRNLLEVTNLTKKLELFETVDEAVKAFSKNIPQD